MRLSFHGSRGLSDERVQILILEAIDKYQPNGIVTHAEPDGVCGLARRIAKELAIPLTVHYLNFKYRRGAFEHRSIDVLKDSDRAVFIHDGTSKGTSNEVKLAVKYGIPHDYHVVKPSPHASSVGFEIEEDWGGLFDEEAK